MSEQEGSGRLMERGAERTKRTRSGAVLLFLQGFGDDFQLNTWPSLGGSGAQKGSRSLEPDIV